VSLDLASAEYMISDKNAPAMLGIFEDKLDKGHWTEKRTKGLRKNKKINKPKER